MVIEERSSDSVELLICWLESAVISTNLGFKITVQDFKERFIQANTEDRPNFGAEHRPRSPHG